MRAIHRRRWALQIAAGVAIIGWAGACSQPPATPSPAPGDPLREQAGPHAVRLSENERLGIVVSVDRRSAHAVLRPDPDVRMPETGRIVSRRADFTPTAVLQLTPLRLAGAVGATILAGRPGDGDEVVAPGPELQAWGEAQLAAEDRAAPHHP